MDIGGLSAAMGSLCFELHPGRAHRRRIRHRLTVRIGRRTVCRSGPARPVGWPQNLERLYVRVGSAARAVTTGFDYEMESGQRRGRIVCRQSAWRDRSKVQPIRIAVDRGVRQRNLCAIRRHRPGRVPCQRGGEVRRIHRLLDAVFGGLERAFTLIQVRCDSLLNECRGEACDRQDREDRKQQQTSGKREASRTLRSDRPATASVRGRPHRFEFRIWIVFVTSMRS